MGSGAVITLLVEHYWFLLTVGRRTPLAIFQKESHFVVACSKAEVMNKMHIPKLTSFYNIHHEQIYRKPDKRERSLKCKAISDSMSSCPYYLFYVFTPSPSQLHFLCIAVTLTTRAHYRGRRVGSWQHHPGLFWLYRFRKCIHESCKEACDISDLPYPEWTNEYCRYRKECDRSVKEDHSGHCYR